MNTESITKKLIIRADEKLQSETQEIFADIVKKTSYKGSVMFLITNAITIEDNKIKMSPSDMIKILKDFIFEKHHEGYRKREIDQFMKQVESLRADVDDLYNEIQN